jgi:hypothetical protein
LSSLHPFEYACPHTPRQQYERVCIITAEKQGVVFGKPSFERGEPCPVFTAFHLRDRWRLVAPKQIKINVVPAATKSAGA